MDTEKMFDLSGKKALITGAGQGVGAGIAKALSEAGADVVINDLNPEAAESTAEAIRQAGGGAETSVFDVTDLEAVRAGFSEAGHIDILVNNAGVPSGMGLKPFAETTPEDWKTYIDLNLYGVINCCSAAVAPMSETGWGRIITISSGAGVTGLNIGVSAYGAGKGGAVAFMRHLAMETSRAGITANSLALGLMKNEKAPSDIVAPMAKQIPVGRLGEPEDIGWACVFLASPEAAWITGQTLNIDGGALTR